MVELFDTHAHLVDEQFDNVGNIIDRARIAGVTRFLAVGTTLTSSAQCAALALNYQGVYASAGIHPNHTHEALAGDWEQVVQLARLPHVVALGETGLDKHWDFAPFSLQQEYFERHLRLSQEINKPFIVHTRDCSEDVLNMLRKARQRGPLIGIMHSFTGDVDLARECIGLGLYISFAGMVTFKKSDELRAVAKEIPAERLLIETDAPYLSPHPHRSIRPNEPALIVHTAECIATARGMSLGAFAALTTANACRVLGVP